VPLYEFRCQDCQHRFTVLVPYSERERVVCPKCSGSQVRPLIGSFSLGSGAGGGCTSGAGAVGGG